jgi:excisionase family DNA binding protein
VTTPTEVLDALAYPPALAAKVAGRSHSRIKKAIREKELTARKDGRATLIERAELQRWLATLPTIGRKPEPTTAYIAAKDNAVCQTPPSRLRANARSNVLENSRR